MPGVSGGLSGRHLNWSSANGGKQRLHADSPIPISDRIKTNPSRTRGKRVVVREQSVMALVQLSALLTKVDDCRGQGAERDARIQRAAEKSITGRKSLGTVSLVERFCRPVNPADVPDEEEG